MSEPEDVRKFRC